MQYPLISEYVRAVQDASDNLGELAHLTPELDSHGEPYRSSGAFAVVFKMKDEQTGKCYALKCFTEEQEGRAEAYRMIADELDCVDSSYVTQVKYLEREIFVDSSCEDDEYPVLLMDWVDGETMETYIASNCQDEYAMAMLCYRFCKMAAWLRSQPFAHGDVKPDNIIVRPDGSLTLVDYDGMFVPAMKGQKSPTVGTKDFSHPMRTVDDFDETIDDFALASIALSLKAISLTPSLLDEYGASDRLLFSADDYRDLSKSKVMAALLGLMNDEETKTLCSLFLLASAKKNLEWCSFRLFVFSKPFSENNTQVKLASSWFDMGEKYYNGQDVERNYEEAVKWYRKASEQGDVRAQCNLGLCYKNGQGVERSYEEAVKWFRKAAEQGNARAQCNLGGCYSFGWGVGQSYKEAVKWFRKAAEQGDADAQCHFGVCYDKGQGVEQSYKEAVKWYRKAAEQGNVDAQCHLWVCYKFGQGVEQSYEEAVKWHRKAVEQVQVRAQYIWDVFLENTREDAEGVEQSYEDAVKVERYRKAAEQGNARAQCNLGFCYKNGQGVERSYEEAVKWFRKSAEQGDADAQCCLGVCYRFGQGVERNYEEAVKWYRKAVEQGDACAQCSLGFCYEKGIGVEQSYEEAVKWYRKAAEQGEADAQYCLGICYWNGQGVEQSYEEAEMWYLKAAEQGHVDALAAL